MRWRGCRFSWGKIKSTQKKLTKSIFCVVWLMSWGSVPKYFPYLAMIFFLLKIWFFSLWKNVRKLNQYKLYNQSWFRIFKLCTLSILSTSISNQRMSVIAIWWKNMFLSISDSRKSSKIPLAKNQRQNLQVHFPTVLMKWKNVIISKPQNLWTCTKMTSSVWKKQFNH